MRRATPLGHDQPSAPPTSDREAPANLTSSETPDAEHHLRQQPLSVLRGGAPAERARRGSGEHRRRLTPARAVIQPSDPDRLRRALEALREMNKLTRRRTEDMRKLSQLSRELSEQMTAFGNVIGGLKIRSERRSGAI